MEKKHQTHIESINLSLERCFAGVHIGCVEGGGVAESSAAKLKEFQASVAKYMDRIPNPDIVYKDLVDKD